MRYAAWMLMSEEDYGDYVEEEMAAEADEFEDLMDARYYADAVRYEKAADKEAK